ncbi:hypothetical protein AKJ57_05100 [candidate division MSBL1 archaeon SCGC-AAA259A05]|uniref:4Fe-4S ferredoxin-type domain-containing protein n=1 Tax=candidate division MSBL1 archaeon SCGC-AAA259A05 TaxID=1698259 RepID=A0A133U637_9EURY|nr:hypothetical protein AKJ57_05100 [candidate division MSBL1 archaeon SCGC-AAA259A05]
MRKRILLRYSMEKAGKPILASVIRETDISMNILHADLTPEGGEIFVAMDEPEEKVREAIDIFESRGVQVEEVERAITLDEESCIECGACVSLCPTEALELDEDYSLVLVEDKCVHCGACVPACPVRALSMKEL